jgi:hypothetical protein
MRATFKDRTNSMVNALQGIEKLRTTKGLNGIVILIGGTFHLQEGEVVEPEGIQFGSPLEQYSELSLAALYEELNNRKVVVLKSKLIKRHKLDRQPYQYFEQCYPYSSTELFIDLKGINNALLQATSPKKLQAAVNLYVEFDTGYGNSLVLCGDGGGLSWDPTQGKPLQCQDASKWSINILSDVKEFKLVLKTNDGTFKWEKGNNRSFNNTHFSQKPEF